MDFEDEEPASPTTEQAEESYLYNEEGNQIDDELEVDADADGDDDGEGEPHSATDDSASDEDGDGDGSDGSENEDEDEDEAMDVDVAIVGPPSAGADKGRSTRSARLNGVDGPLDPKDPLPPSLVRQRLFFPPPSQPQPRTLDLSPLISIPIASPVHALAASLCLSHVLTGSQDGYVRDWDTFASANGGREGRPVLPKQGIRGGVCRGWWAGEDTEGGGKKDPVWSLACQKDGLWGLSGMGNGSINLFTVRHAVGKTHHALSGGHKGAVSALALGESEDILYSGGWDGAVVEWDLHTGQQIRSFPTQPSQISSLSLQPLPSGPSASPQTDYNIYIRDLPIPPPSTTTSEPNGDGPSTTTRASSVDPPDVLPPPPFPPTSNGIAENGHLLNGTGSTLASRRPSELDAEGEDDDLTSADADGEREEVDSTMPSPSATATAASPPAPHPDFPPPPPTTNGHADEAPPPPPPPSPPPRWSPMSPATYSSFSPDVLLTSAINGDVLLWDRRVARPRVGALTSPTSKTNPWCMSAGFASDGGQVYAGRRNGGVDVWDMRRMGGSGGGLWKTLKGPEGSGPVSCVVWVPGVRQVAVASADAIRLWSTSFEEEEGSEQPPHKVVAGHPGGGGTVSSMLIDPLSRFLIAATGSSSRGWGASPVPETPSIVTYHSIESVF